MAVAYRTLPPEPARTALLDALARALSEFFRENLISVVLFGSVARGEGGELSDVDLLIVCEELPGSRWKRYALFHQALAALEGMLEELARQHCYPEFRPILKTRAEAEVRTPLYLDMVEDARVLYDRHGFFSKVLAGLKRRLTELGARRVFLEDGSWYWDLKPDYRFGEIFEI
jgi:predicted nucleotidyltransferase